MSEDDKVQEAINKNFSEIRKAKIDKISTDFKNKYGVDYFKWYNLTDEKKKQLNEYLKSIGKKQIEYNNLSGYPIAVIDIPDMFHQYTTATNDTDIWTQAKNKYYNDIRKEENSKVAKDVGVNINEQNSGKSNIEQGPNGSTIETFPDGTKIKVYKDSAGNAVWEYTDKDGKTTIGLQGVSKGYTKEEWAKYIADQRAKKQAQSQSTANMSKITDAQKQEIASRQTSGQSGQSMSTSNTGTKSNNSGTSGQSTGQTSRQTSGQKTTSMSTSSTSSTSASTPAKQQTYEKFDVSDFNSYLRKKYGTDILAGSRIEQAIRNYSDVKGTDPKEAFTQYSAYRMPKLRSIYSESSKGSTEIIDDMVNKGIITEDDARRGDVFGLATKSGVTGTDKEKMPVEQKYKETMVTTPVEHTVRKEGDKVIIDEKGAQDTGTYLGVKSDMPSSVGIRKTVTQKK